MHKYETEYSKEAKQDLIEIKRYIKDTLKQPETAQNLVSRIRRKIDMLEDNPKIYAIIDLDITKKLEIRKLVIDNYIVFYRVEGDKIQIVRIMYGRRNWINLI